MATQKKWKDKNGLTKTHLHSSVYLSHIFTMCLAQRNPTPINESIGGVDHPKSGVDNSYDLGVIMHEFPSMFIGEFRS